MTKVSAPAVTQELFGGVFDSDGSGHYPGLELINLVVCCVDGVLPSETNSIRLRRHAHEFGRQLITNELPSERLKSILLSDHAANVVSKLLKCLELETPNVVKTKRWERTHFFPYTRSLVHWDARAGRSKVEGMQLERRYLRGAGAYAYSVLRHDKNEKRLTEIRSGFLSLYPENQSSALEQLAITLRDAGYSDPVDRNDTIESKSKLHNDKWEDLFRDGMANILSHVNLPSVQRVRAVMNWTSLWTCLMQASRALKLDDRSHMVIIADCSGGYRQLRTAAQRNFKDIVTTIQRVSRKKGVELGSLPTKQLESIRAFFGNTAAAAGLLNAWKGRRHFTLRLEAIETLAMAAMPIHREMTYESFLTEWLFQRCGIVIGREAAAQEGMLVDFDGTIFEENERKLAEKMQAAGLLKVFSDATRMVSPGGEES